MPKNPASQAVIDGLFPIAGRWRIEHGPDYPALHVIGAVLAELTSPQPRKLDCAIHEVIDALEDLAEQWRAETDGQHVGLPLLRAVIADLERGKYRAGRGSARASNASPAQRGSKGASKPPETKSQPAPESQPSSDSQPAGVKGSTSGKRARRMHVGASS